MPELNQETVLHAPALTAMPRSGWSPHLSSARRADERIASEIGSPPASRQVGGWTFFVDSEAPNWASVDERGAWLLHAAAQGPVRFSELVSHYGAQFHLDSGKSWVHVQAFVSEALRHGLFSLAPVERAPYQGRAAHLRLSKLREAWLHTNNSCNLACSHCLVSSSPKGEPGLPTATWRRLIEEVIALGVDRCYITGGEPFVRPDLPELIRLVTDTHGVEVIILTNATLFAGARKALLDGFDRAKVKFQVSVDGSTPEINDPIRGRGSFAAAVEGLRELTRRGFEVTLTTVVTWANLTDLPNITRLAGSCGVRGQHLMWLHRRGRVAAAPRHFWSDDHQGRRGMPNARAFGLGSEDGAASVGRVTEESPHLFGQPMAGLERRQKDVGSPTANPKQVGGWFPSTGRLIDAVRAVKQAADREGIVLDNAASFELRANAPAGVKFDLGNAGWQSLCVYADGQVYPSAAFANHKPLWCGDATNGMTLGQIWRNSPVLQQIREASVIRKRQASDDPLRYLTGGGDVEHSYFFSGDFVGDDPYYPLYQALLLDAMDVLTARKMALVNRRSGYDAPRIFHAMGDGAIVCGTTELGDNDTEVAFLHSNCVLSFDVEKPREIVQEFYGQAAEEPQKELCCPTKFSENDIAHIPKDVIERFYGCGSPVSDTKPQPGEVYVDLGSGAGIDCFIAAKHVGPTGRVIGIDMTDQMLAVAQANQPKVAQALGYDVVDFRKGYLEAVPLEDKTADIVTSNCVINLSPDKPKVFAEIWRILKDRGRAVIADIVSDREVPPRLKVNEQLWGECIVGSLTEEQFLAMLEQAGFYGLSVLKKTFWKTIPARPDDPGAGGEGYRFFSVTVQGFKFEKTAGCQFIGQRAIYKGPFKAALDEEGHLFPRNVEIEVCTDTATKLSHAPYTGQFVIVELSGERSEAAVSACCPDSATGTCC